ncbi:MAG: tryptophan--tRNA ligase, partial [Aquificaceae bacterium]|nr:tryptophan--tRNA ligase [Aquificaceae bacterium]
RHGKLGCVDCKKLMFEGLENFLMPIRDRREELSKDRKGLKEVIELGSERARTIAVQTIKEVREKVRVG